MERFWDTSALLGVLVEQAVAHDLRALSSAPDQTVIWWGTYVEAVAGLRRLGRMGNLGDDRIATLQNQFAQFVAEAREISPVPDVRDIAVRNLRVHDLRAGDALQLAAALVWADHRPSGRFFVCLDQRLRAAAVREGFTVLPNR